MLNDLLNMNNLTMYTDTQSGDEYVFPHLYKNPLIFVLLKPNNERTMLIHILSTRFVVCSEKFCVISIFAFILTQYH